MKVVAGLAFLLVNVRLSDSCSGEEGLLICLDIPQGQLCRNVNELCQGAVTKSFLAEKPAFPPGYSSLVMFPRDVGEINATMFHSDALATVTRLRIEGAGVTGIAEGAFRSLQSLSNLSLDQNLLTQINPNWFARPETLGELNLTRNRIEVLNGVMLSGLVNLRQLRLSKNRIRTIHPDSFNSQTLLAELDLSENKMTQVSPQVFSSLRSTKIKLDGNPWDCSCGVEDFVDFLKDLRSRTLLERPEEVTCGSPPSLKGHPVWNVSACVTPPPSGPPPTAKTFQPRPTDGPASTAPATPPARPASETQTSVLPRSTVVLTTPSTTALKTATNVSPHTSVTKISVHAKPSAPPLTLPTPPKVTEFCTSRPSSDTPTVCMLIIVIVVLSLLVLALCLLVMLHRRKRNNKAVMPGPPKETRQELEEGGSRWSQTPSLSEKSIDNHCDSEVGCRRSSNGVRAKSANAILTTSPYCAPVKDQVSLHTEAQAQLSEDQTEAKQRLGGSEVDGGNEPNTADAADGRNPHIEPQHGFANADTAPYLSIGTNKNNPDDFHKQPTDGPRSQKEKVLGRISTWPPTAVQWQARCKMMEEKKREEGVDVFTPMSPGEAKTVKRPSGSDQDQENEETQTRQTEDPLKMNVAHMKPGHSESSQPNDEDTPAGSEARANPSMKRKEQPKKKERKEVTRGERTLGQNKDMKPAEKNADSKEPRQVVTSRQRAENRSTGSKAPSGGASPDDETLLSGNEYAFMDLLHEVTQNNGRWTRERWKQTHVNRQQQRRSTFQKLCTITEIFPQ